MYSLSVKLLSRLQTRPSSLGGDTGGATLRHGNGRALAGFGCRAWDRQPGRPTRLRSSRGSGAAGPGAGVGVVAVARTKAQAVEAKGSPGQREPNPAQLCGPLAYV